MAAIVVRVGAADVALGKRSTALAPSVAVLAGAAAGIGLPHEIREQQPHSPCDRHLSRERRRRRACELLYEVP